MRGGGAGDAAQDPSSRRRWQPTETVLLGGTALVVGLLSGVGVWLFKLGIGWVQAHYFDAAGDRLSAVAPHFTLVLLPLGGGLFVGLLLQFFIREERHHGISGIMEAVALGGGRLRYWRIPLKSVAAAASIGSGASVGPEDPSVQIGANIGSMFGQKLRLSNERLRALVAAGAASGVAAAFNAPIAGVFFALEIILGEIGGSAFGVVVMAAVVASVFTQAVAGAEPAFHVPAYAFQGWHELPLYVVLGLLAGPLAALYVRVVHAVRDRFQAWRAPRWLKPTLAGAVVGAVGLFLPQVLGVGYDTIEATLAGNGPALGITLALLGAKLGMTALCIGAGFPGGVFAPSLFLGAMLGAACGTAAQFVFPSSGVHPSALAMVGMAAVLAGTVHAPLTAVLILFEMTNDYRIILPLMFAVVVSLWISQRLQRHSIYTLGLERKGIRLQRGRDIEVLESLQVEEVMQCDPPVLRQADSLADAIEVLQRLHYHGLPVLDAEGTLVGVLTVQDIDRARAEGTDAGIVGDACSRDVLVTYPHETLGQALRRMSARGIGRLPVVAPSDDKKLVGLLRRTDVVRAYDAALTRRAALRQDAQRVRLGESTGVNILELVIEPGAPCAGRTVAEVGWPHDCVLATLRRRGTLRIPRGETSLQPGDVLTVVTEVEAQQAVRSLCESAASE